jgi:hypothetical protein
MTLTREMEIQVEEEIRVAIETHGENIQYDNSDKIFYYKKTGGTMNWDLVCCTVCPRPNILHADPWSEDQCILVAINQYTKAEYIERLEGNKALKGIAKRNIPARTPGLGKNQNWYHKEDTPWERDKNSENLEDEYEDVPQVEYEVVTEVAYKKEVEYETDHEDDEENDYEEDSEYDDYDEAEYEEADYEDESEVEFKYENKDKFKHRVECEEFSEEKLEEGRYWMRQIDDYISQNPSEKDKEEWMMRLHPEALRRLLEDEEKWGNFKPRNLTERQYIEELLRKEDEKIRSNQKKLQQHGKQHCLKQLMTEAPSSVKKQQKFLQEQHQQQLQQQQHQRL